MTSVPPFAHQEPLSFNTYNRVLFEWDMEKNRANVRKHGVDFETASLVFADPNLVLIEDRIGEDDEQRWHAIGLVGSSFQLLVAVHVYMETENEEEVIRIIPARKAGPRESRRYFK